MNLIEQYQKRLNKSLAYKVIKHLNEYERVPVGTIVYRLPRVSKCDTAEYYTDIISGHCISDEDNILRKVIDSNVKYMRVVSYTEIGYKEKEERGYQMVREKSLVLVHKEHKRTCTKNECMLYTKCPYERSYSVVIPVYDNDYVAYSCNYVLKDI